MRGSTLRNALMVAALILDGNASIHGMDAYMLAATGILPVAFALSQLASSYEQRTQARRILARRYGIEPKRLYRWRESRFD